MNNTVYAKPKNCIRRRVPFVLSGMLLIVLILSSVAHLVLKRRCDLIAQQLILPQLQAYYKTDVSLQNISVNLLTGVLVVEGATIGQPPGFDNAPMVEIPRFRLRMALLDLWREDTVTVRSLRIKGAHLNLTRNPQGCLNLAYIAEESDSSSAQRSTGPDGRQVATDVRAEASRLLMSDNPSRLAIDKARIYTSVLYTDHNPIFQPEPLKIELDLRISLDRLTNYGQSDRMAGKLQVEGDICAAGQRTPLELRGWIAPLTDPRRLTFDLTGSTKPFDLTTTPPLANWLGLEQGLVACTVTLEVSNNVIDPAKSILHFNFSEARLSPDARRRLGGIILPRVFTLRIPMSGTLESPSADFGAAVADLLTGNDMIGSFLQGLLSQPDTRMLRRKGCCC